MVTILIYVPETNVELIFSIAAIFLTTGVFGYTLNLIGTIINDITKKSKEYNNERRVMNRFFKKKNIPEKLRERITLYLEFMHQESMEENLEEEK